MRLVPKLVSAGAAAALAVSLLAVAGPASAAPADPVEVTPSALPVGATPAVSWYDAARQKVVRPGQRSVTVPVRTAGRPGGSTWLLNAHGGWLRHTYVDGTSFAGTNGKARRLGPKSSFEVQMVARDGRTFVDLAVRYNKSDVRKWSTAVRVRRTCDGKVLRSRTFKQSVVQVRAVTSSTVALNIDYPRGGNTVWATEFWDQRTGRLRVFRQHQEPGPPPSPGFYRAPAASLSHHLIVAQGESAVRDTRTGRALWSTGAGEGVFSFSPDGTRAVTFADYFDGYEDGASPRLMRIRDARTGAVLATYHGLFTKEIVESPNQGPIWESGSKLLVVAYEGLTQDDEGYSHPSEPSWVRCTAAGSCAQVPIDPSADYVTLPRSS